MEIVILVVVMVLVGLLIGALSPKIFKGEAPYGQRGDYIASVLSTVIIGLMDWFVIPAMGFSDMMKYLGVALEPALGALIVLWLIRKAKS